MPRLLSVIFVFLMVCMGSSQAFAREQVIVKATVTDKYIRLFFYCKQPVKFTTNLSGNKLKISFQRDIDVDASPIANASSANISAAEFSNNTATITLAGDSYNVRKFLGEDFIGVDILKPETSKTKKIEEAKAEIVGDKEIQEKPVAVVVPDLNRQSEAEKVVASIPQVDSIDPEEIPTRIEVKKIVPEKPSAKIIPTPKLRQKPTQTQAKGLPRDVDVKALAAIVPSAGVEPPAAAAAPEAAKELPASAPRPEVAVSAPAIVKPAEEKKEVNAAPVAVQDVVAAKPLPVVEKPAEVAPVVAAKPAEVVPPASPAPAPLNDTVAVNPSPPVAITSGDDVKTTEKKVEALPAISLPKTAELLPDDELEAEKEESDIPKIISAAEHFKDSLLSKMVFEWDDKVSASVFKRAGYLWIVFDKNKEVNVKSLLQENSAYFVKGEQMPNRFYTILRLKLKDDINFVSYKENNNWVVGFVKDKAAPLQTAKIDMKFSDLSGSKVLLDSDMQLKPLRLIDSEVGDEIVILPFADESTGMKQLYKYVDFVFLETSQGAVIQVISDSVEVAVLDTGVTVAGPSNRIANASQEALKELREKAEEARLKAERLRQQSAELTLLKFTTWKLGGNTSYKKDLLDLEWKITESDWAEKNQYRLALARFYFAHGLYTESLGTLAIIKEYDEKFGATNDVKVVEATALYMLGRYKEAADLYGSMNMEELSLSHRTEAQFWATASDIQLSNQIKTDKFLTKNPLDQKDEDDSTDKVGNTKLMRDTSNRLLKIIRKMDPDFVNADELQKLEATARFVTDHYQEAINRFEETDLLSSGSDVFQAEDNKLWWSTEVAKRSDVAELPFIPNIDGFLKNYPENIFNDFSLIAVENSLKRNDLAKSEEILAVFKDEKRLQQKNSIEFFRGLYFAKNDEDDKAVETWKKLAEDIDDRFNRARAIFASTIFELDKKRIDVKQAIANLNTVRSVWRGGQLEFYSLNLLGEFYLSNHQPMEAFRIWRESISAFPGSDESLLIAKKMSENFAKIFAQGEADKMPKLDAITLYYEFRELTPIGKAGDEMISKLVDRLIDVDLLDRAAALLTHQVRFRLVGEDRDNASTKLVKIHLMNHDAQKALDVLDATDNSGIVEEAVLERKYLRSQALLELGKNNKVLSLLGEDGSKKAAFLRADVYWRNGVWRKVIDELEVPFRELRRDEKTLSLEETNQLIRLAVSYALIDRQKRLQILYEDFAGLVDDQAKQNLLTFIASNKGPVDYQNLEQSVGYTDMEIFLNNYMKLNMDAPAPDATNPPAEPAAPSAQAAPAASGAAG